MQSFKQAVILAAWACCSSVVADDHNMRPSTGYSVDSANFNMRYIPETDQVEFIVTLKDSGWFGLLPGDTDMTLNADIIAFFAMGDFSSYGDYHALGH